MSGKVEINGNDLYAQGFGVRDATAWWDGLTVELSQTSPWKTHGSLRGTGYAARPKAAPLGLFLEEATLANRESKLDTLRRYLAETPSGVDTLRVDSDGEVEVKISPSSRVVYAVYRGDTVTPPAGLGFAAGHAEVTLDLMAYDAAKYEDGSSSQSSIGSTPIQITLGSLPSYWELAIAGAATDPEFVVYENSGGAAGSELWRITLDYDVAAAETLTLDGLLHQIDLDGADVTNVALPLGSSTYFRQLDGQGEASVWCKVTSGTGTLTWRKKWR